MKYTHDAMIDLVVSDPWISQNQIAAHFGYTPAWVSIIFSSDAFRERLEQRKQELIDPTIRASIEERLRAVVSRSLDVLAEKLAQPAKSVPDNLALRALEYGAKGLGLGQQQQAPVHVHADHLNILANRLVALRSDVYAQPVPQPLMGECHEVKAV